MTQLSEQNKQPEEVKKKKSSTRLREIIKVFLAYNVLQNLAKQEHPEKVREAFETLGPTFIKVGQMLSVRTDILTPAFIVEMRKLQDNVKTDSFEQVKQTIETEMELPLEEIFASFDEEPLASASIGQTHKAVLKTGELVAVKVQHPGIKEEIALDLSLFSKALPLMKYIPESTVIDPKETFLEVKNSLEKELDSLIEAKNGKEFYQKNNGWEVIRTPIIYQEYCTSKLLVMEFMPGESLKRFVAAGPKADQTPEDYQKIKKALGDTLVRNFVKQVFEDGFFHADPHPGNLFVDFISPEKEPELYQTKAEHHEKTVGATQFSYSHEEAKALPNYRLIFLDFGMMGHLDKSMVQKLTNVMDSLYMNQTKRIGRAILQLCNQVGPVDEDLFFEQLAPLLDNNYGISIGEMNLQQLFFQVIAICHQNNLQVPQEVTMLVKAVATFEGVIRELDPDISLVEIATPFAKKYFMEKMDWSFELKKSGLDFFNAVQAAPKIPTRTLEVLDDLSKGKTKINLELKKQNEWLNRIESMVNRVVIGLILSALIVGSSMLVEFNQGIGSSFASLLGMIGYGIALLAILFLAVDILRKRRKK